LEIKGLVVVVFVCPLCGKLTEWPALLFSEDSSCLLSDTILYFLCCSQPFCISNCRVCLVMSLVLLLQWEWILHFDQCKRKQRGLQLYIILFSTNGRICIMHATTKAVICNLYLLNLFVQILFIFVMTCFIIINILIMTIFLIFVKKLNKTNVQTWSLKVENDTWMGQREYPISEAKSVMPWVMTSQHFNTEDCIHHIG
jgi:hypothetical protein